MEDSHRKFHRVRIHRCSPVTQDQALVALEMDEALRHEHRHPGQYCLLRPLGDAAAPFALASRPGAPHPRFLVRIGSSAGAALASLPDGAEIEATAPLGNGFDLTHALRRDVIFVATGTGIAPILSALAHCRDDRPSYGGMTLYYGVRNVADVAFGDLLSELAAADIGVAICESQPDPKERSSVSAPIGARMVYGRVQDLLARDLDKRDPGEIPKLAVVAAGQDDMLQALSGVLLARGGTPEQIIVNL